MESEHTTSSGLEAQHCVPCSGRVPTLELGQIEELAEQIDPGWRVVDGHHLKRRFRFKDFKQALVFVDRVGLVAEHEGHHPDIYISYGKVTLEIWTHAAGGLTRNDFVLAAKIDRLS
jgi:4a-hydroxytetrahydrobiopterin dehydratase